jgi:hypothetical protein
MRRFRRWLLNGIAALSLLLCVATSITWAKSGYYLFMHAASICDNNASIVSINHGILQYISSLHTHRPVTNSVTFISQERSGRQWPRYEWDETWGRSSTGALHVRMPLWWLVGLFAILPIIRIYKYPGLIRRERWRQSLCPMCGYDLRGTPDRCPECGTIPPIKEIASN